MHSQAREAVSAIQKTFAEDASEILPYLTERVLPHLRSNIDNGYPGWTTNNVESENHVLKNASQWRQHKLPELIQIMKSVVRVQYSDAEKAIYGEGDYVLKPNLRDRCSRSYDDWVTLSDKQRQQVFTACYKLPSLESVSVSTDGRLKVNHSATAGKKPHQRKRPINERTTSLPKMPPH